MRIPGLRRITAKLLPFAPPSAQQGLFSLLAGQQKVSFVVTEGAHGPFEGALRDHVIFGEYLRTHTYAEHVIEIFRQFFSQAGGGTFIDIGANIGLISVPVSRFENVRCIAIEPEPVNFGCLVRNVQRNNRADRVTPINRAVYKHKTAIEFELSENNWGDHRIRVPQAGADLYSESSRRTISVLAEPLDDLVTDPAGPLAIKIDIQGGETAALQGAQRLLARADMMISEFWPYAISRAGATAAEFLDAIKPHFSFGTAIGHRTDAASLSTSLKSTPLRPIGELRQDLLRHAEQTPKIYTDILLSKTSDLFIPNSAP